MTNEIKMSAEFITKKGVEEKILNPCAPCQQEEGRQIESVVFCMECSEHLCESCCHHHRKLKVTRAHHLVEIGKSTGNGVKTEHEDANITEYCPEHPGKCLEYYCENDDSLCCKTCKEISHSGCGNIKCIMDVAKKFVESGEISHTEESLKSLTYKVSSQVQSKRKQTISISDQAAVALIQIKTERSNIIEKINKLADEAEYDIKTKSSDVKGKLQNEIETMESVLETLSTTEKCLATVKQNANEPQVYIAAKKADQQLKKYSTYADEVETNMTEKNVKFKFDGVFQTLQEKLVTMGTVVIGKAESEQDNLSQGSTNLLQVNNSKRHFKRHSSSYAVGFKRKKAIPVGGHSVRIPGDKTTCHVTGSAVLQDGRIILADHNNKSIKFFNKNCSYINHISLSSRPTDIVILSENEIATSLIDEHAIQFVCIGSPLCLTKRIETTYPYYGLSFSDQQLLFGTTTVEDVTGEIHALDMSGKIVGIIKKINDQLDLIRPTAIYVDNRSQLLYVNDLGRNSVFCLDISQGVDQYSLVFVYTDRNLELRSGIAVDTEGYIYVSSGNMTVHQVSFNGQKVHEILSLADGLGLPHRLAFSPGDNHLLVSEFKENSFKMFALR